MARDFPDAVVDYELPNAAVGFRRATAWSPTSWRRTRRSVRVIMIAAVKNGLALVARRRQAVHAVRSPAAAGMPSPPTCRSPGHGQYVDSFSWRGDRRVRPRPGMGEGSLW